jgi:hypothetical protein
MTNRGVDLIGIRSEKGRITHAGLPPVRPFRPVPVPTREKPYRLIVNVAAENS